MGRVKVAGAAEEPQLGRSVCGGDKFSLVIGVVSRAIDYHYIYTHNIIIYIHIYMYIMI